MVLLEEKTYKINLSDNDLDLICVSLNFFIYSSFEGALLFERHENDFLAANTLTKIKRSHYSFEHRDVWIMYISLFNLRLIINETGCIPYGVELRGTTKSYLSSIDALLQYFNNNLKINNLSLASYN